MMDPHFSDIEAFDEIGRRMEALGGELAKVIVGQEQVIERLLVALLCRGHVRVIGVPGLAKTLLVRTLAEAVGLSFRRIQFTPDMMPSDIIGAELLQEDTQSGRRRLEFARGPIFAQLLLADEVNRAPPKTQSALLEAMAEQQVTTAGQTMALDQPFVVIATQNPIEQAGTYPLPEAQLDRFMFSLWMDYPNKAQEMQVVAQPPRIHGGGKKDLGGVGAEAVREVLTSDDLLRFSRLIRVMPVTEHVVDYAVRLARATRPEMDDSPPISRDYVSWGAGPRAGQYMVHAARAYAAMAGRPTPSTEDVRQAAVAVLDHRVVVNYAAAGAGMHAREIVEAVISEVKEPDYQ